MIEKHIEINNSLLSKLDKIHDELYTISGGNMDIDINNLILSLGIFLEERKYPLYKNYKKEMDLPKNPYEVGFFLVERK